MAEPDFGGKTVVITGAGRGLGLAMARRFGQAGAHVVIAEIIRERGQSAAETLSQEGISAQFAPLDVRVPEQSVSLVNQIAQERGKIDVWVNNAGLAFIAPAESLPIKQWDETMAVMVSGSFYCSQAVGRQMLKQGRGVIINMGSVDSFKAIEERVAYCTAKAAIVMLTQALAIEWAKRGVRVVAIAPGPIRTELVQQVFAEGKASPELYIRRTPLHKLGTVEDIAEAALFLASDEASYITGETLRVDGGWVAYQLF
ncbi:MAG TPA: SDR family oxidoreductase [Anaerolineae bacterium]|nr:SDR family oxidoreductase [Anaerolineae bacterium]